MVISGVNNHSNNWEKAKKDGKTAEKLHGDIPPNWYFRSIQENPFQRYWHKRRFEEVEKVIEPVKGKVLDIGCADGVFTKIIQEKSGASQVVGIDVLKASIKWAKKHWRRNKKLKFVVADAHDLPFKSGSFDAVFILEVLEHLFKPEVVLRETKRVLKKGGYAVMLVPSESVLFKIVWFLWRFSGRMVWKDTHVQSYNNNSLIRLTQKAKFKKEADRKFLLGMLHLVKVRKP